MDKKKILGHLEKAEYELDYFKATYDEARIFMAK